MIEIDDIGEELNHCRSSFHLYGIVYSIRKQKIEVSLQNPVDIELRGLDGLPLEKDAHRVDLEEVELIDLSVRVKHVILHGLSYLWLRLVSDVFLWLCLVSEVFPLTCADITVGKIAINLFDTLWEKYSDVGVQKG